LSLWIWSSIPQTARPARRPTNMATTGIGVTRSRR
jgi:hypothetical protein